MRFIKSVLAGLYSRGSRGFWKRLYCRPEGPNHYGFTANDCSPSFAAAAAESASKLSQQTNQIMMW
jgi:hypothetical protein